MMAPAIRMTTTMTPRQMDTISATAVIKIVQIQFLMNNLKLTASEISAHFKCNKVYG